MSGDKLDQRRPAGSVTHARVDLYEVDLVSGAGFLLRGTRESLRVQVVLCSVFGQGVVVGLIEPAAGDLFYRAVGKSDGDQDAFGKVPVHPDKAFGILLESNQCVPPSFQWLPVSRTFGSRGAAPSSHDNPRRKCTRSNGTGNAAPASLLV
jgi:hypothetical protein